MSQSVRTNNSPMAIDNIASIVEMMQQTQDDDGRGELFFPRLSVRVNYDLLTGDVDNFQLIQSGSVQLIYEDHVMRQLEAKVKKNVKKAIKLYSSVYLLERFVQLNDKAVNKIITSRHGGVNHA